MIRSRLLFLFLLLANLGVSPMGVYACACLVPSQPADIFAEAEWDHHLEESLLPDTAVTAIIGFLTSSILITAILSVFIRFTISVAFLSTRFRLTEFKCLPLTPPPKVA